MGIWKRTGFIIRKLRLPGLKSSADVLVQLKYVMLGKDYRDI